ncbi:hypothetical protein TREMEDRAFT_74127 [Tremella mesenterica DSM 1558]|uniref:uncharacterized protein n=1 Tax=Tremella mesenterica (strain ATCC 24925 / CBS 8224 / DSM 1558 / NBRC 9311 / NRRL Y-6157 / RJB 2259-6 / UBC 559-6) TaxID=578456 RepID=UPI0003F49A95|nr:uncharacterized protein TREMEDRAFT_74127 [Tremella mesenterica DSM 1558]EIW68662.1 hypothetical protein TREMEDRAFT_74127 [Tremella mesenterica DSM 1558]
MSQPATLTSNPGLSKSAKKRSKKAKAQAGTQTSSILSDSEAHRDHLDQLDSLDSGYPDDSELFAPGAYPLDLQYDAEFYDDVPLPPAVDITAQSSFDLPLSFDYSVGSFKASAPITGNPLAHFNISHEDLVQAANELYRRMADPEFGNDDAYWSSLPPHIRQFVRDAVPLQGRSNGDAPKGAQGQQRELYSMAQRIVSAASQGMGLSTGLGSNYMTGANGRQYPQPGLAHELGFHPHPDARDDDLDDDDDFEAEEHVVANGDLPKKKKNKKKKKATPMPDPPPATLPPPAVKQPPRPPLPSQLPTQPALNPPPPPPAPAPGTAPLPPSSRAAGKQPMTSTPASTTNPPRSARAAGKAPATAPAHNHTHHNHPPPAKAPAKSKATTSAPPPKVWQQTSPEARVQIQQFWLELNEAQRRELLSAEVKETMQKMRDQQRNSCACAVCGRKKATVERELQALYTAWYTEMETKVEHQRAAARGQIPPPPGAGPFPGSVEVDANGQIVKLDHRAPDPKLSAADLDESDEYDDEDDFEDDDLEEDDVVSDEADAGDEIDDPHPPSTRPARKLPPKVPVPRPAGTGEDFHSFGANFADIKGGVLTVADDLLKNDSSRFVEMMEQLSLCRAQREEMNAEDIEAETDDEDDDGLDEPLTEHERMEEGMRMFQIFAARMFEKRVYDAYLERQSRRHQEDLLAALEDEENSKKAKEEKKAKEAQKKKEKKKAMKEKAEAEKLAREAAAAAEAEALRAQRAAEERERQRKLNEEKARREASKRAAQEEAQRVAMERKKRQQEEREREEELARKRKEEEKEKARREREREAKEREAREREKREREEKLAAEKAERERIAKEKAEKERIAKEEAEKARLRELEKQEEIRKAKAAEEARKAEEVKAAAALKAQQERERVEKEAAERAAAAAKLQAEKEKERQRLAAAASAAAAAQQAMRTPVQPTPIRSASGSGSWNGVTSQPMLQASAPAFRQPVQPSPPLSQASPVKSAPIRPAPKANFFPPPASQVSYGVNRTPQTAIPPNFRPYPPTQPQSSFQLAPGSSAPGGPISLPTSQAQAYDALRSAPIGIGLGYPDQSRTPTSRLSSADDLSPHMVPIGQLPRSIPVGGPSNEVDNMIDDYRRASVAPIGRPSYTESPYPHQSLNNHQVQPIGTDHHASSSQHHHQHQHQHQHRSSPRMPTQILGSAALGEDDEIVSRNTRRKPIIPAPLTSWEAPTVPMGQSLSSVSSHDMNSFSANSIQSMGPGPFGNIGSGAPVRSQWGTPATSLRAGDRWSTPASAGPLGALGNMGTDLWASPMGNNGDNRTPGQRGLGMGPQRQGSTNLGMGAFMSPPPPPPGFSLYDYTGSGTGHGH